MLRIESTYQRLEQFVNRYPASESHIHGLSEEDIQDAKEVILEEIRMDAASIPGRIYYWLYPFYEGNFLKLVAALGACNMMDTQKDDPETQTAFFRFFKTVPMQERLKLGEKLNQPELTEKAIRIQEKIKARKAHIKIRLDKFHSN
ncbi:MAG: hypothetical protein AAFY71_22380 [Bacteroidota bacterium]